MEQPFTADWDFGYKLAHLGFFTALGRRRGRGRRWLLTRALARAGVLDAFGPGREAVTEV